MRTPKSLLSNHSSIFLYLTELHTAILTDNGFILPRKESTIWCPGFISNVLIGAVSAFSSWAFYGSGASVELAQLTEQSQISLRFSALAGAFLVGVAGAKWITSEVDKQLLKESVKVAAHKNINEKDCEQMAGKSPRQILNEVKRA